MAKLQKPPTPSIPVVPNKNPGSNAKISSDKTATINGHLSGHDSKIMAVRNKNVGK